MVVVEAVNGVSGLVLSDCSSLENKDGNLSRGVRRVDASWRDEGGG